MGASFVHSPNSEHNLVSQLMNNYEWKKISGDSEQFYYENQGPLDEDITDRASKIYEKLQEKFE